jgi:hypothetical protein
MSLPNAASTAFADAPVSDATPATTAPCEDPAGVRRRGEELTTSIAVAVGRAFSRFTENRQRARRSLFGLSMSGLGGCRRKAAYQLAEVEPSDPRLATTGENRPANLGTMIHEGLLPELAEVLGGRAEIEVELVVDVGDTRIVVPGRSDMFWPDAKVLLDLKTVGEHKLGQVVGSGPFEEHLVQVAGYALAAEQGGHAVEWVGWIYIDRATGVSYVVVEPFTDELRAMVVDKCFELANYAASPHDAPRDGAGPGERTANMICNSCPWLRACWGEDAEPGVAGVQSSKVDDFGGMQEVLVGYLCARDAESAAKERKEFYRELIVGNKPGTYGKTRWALTKPSKTVDKNACAKLLDETGQPLPMRTNEPRLIVSWVAPDQTKGAPAS